MLLDTRQPFMNRVCTAHLKHLDSRFTRLVLSLLALSFVEVSKDTKIEPNQRLHSDPHRFASQTEAVRAGELDVRRI